jgi:hypothetical protein
MKKPFGLQLCFFALISALLVCVATAIDPTARAEAGAICSASAPATSIRAPKRRLLPQSFPR